MKARTFSWITAFVFALFLGYGCSGETQKAEEAAEEVQEVVEEVVDEVVADTTVLDSMMEEVEATMEEKP